jgi:hypothetical protein
VRGYPPHFDAGFVLHLRHLEPRCELYRAFAMRGDRGQVRQSAFNALSNNAINGRRRNRRTRSLNFRHDVTAHGALDVLAAEIGQQRAGVVLACRWRGCSIPQSRQSRAKVSKGMEPAPVRCLRLTGGYNLLVVPPKLQRLRPTNSSRKHTRAS